MKKQFGTVYVICVLELITSSIRGNDFFEHLEKYTSFDDMVSSLTSPSHKIPVEELEKSVDQKWEDSHGHFWEFVLNNITEVPLTVITDVFDSDNINIVPLVYPVSGHDTIASIETVEPETKGNFSHVQLIPDIAHGSDSANDYKLISKNAFENLLLYLQPTEVLRDAENTPVDYKIPAGEHQEVPPPQKSSYFVKEPQTLNDGKKTMANPLHMLTRNLFRRPFDPKEFLKWSSKKLLKAIYPYYHKPKIRYPYYDEEGNGRLLYGYGTDTLYKYEIFRPLQGYL